MTGNLPETFPVCIIIQALITEVNVFRYVSQQIAGVSTEAKSNDPAKAKRSAGRPPLGERKKQHRIQVCTTAEELAELEAAANASGKPLSVWCRENLLRLARRS